MLSTTSVHENMIFSLHSLKCDCIVVVGPIPLWHPQFAVHPLEHYLNAPRKPLSLWSLMVAASTEFKYLDSKCLAVFGNAVV